jgi:hypothetical protein
VEKLAVERMELKVRRFEERLKELINEHKMHVKESPPRYDDIPFGINPEDLPPPSQTFALSDVRSSLLWNQMLYEGIMEALGYSKNQAPFLKLARSTRLDILQDYVDERTASDQIHRIEALLFGAGGLLRAPRATDDTESKKYLATLRQQWKQFRVRYHHECLHESEWQFFRLRPENFPTIRLAGAARLIPTIIEQNLLRVIIQNIKSDGQSSGEKYRSLASLFVVSADSFWVDHYLFGEKAKHPVGTLIGKQRIGDIIVNVLLPICFLYARIFRDKAVRQEAIALFKHCPAPTDNTVVRTMDQLLIKGKFLHYSAMDQQGMLQLYKSYCIDERCEECAVGKSLRITVNGDDSPKEGR